VPLQNRVTPFGDLVADPARGLVYGNRGCLHDESGRIRRRFNGKRWIACRLEFRGWQRGALMQPGRFTELFFLDEVTALAAGHRPCALCRREDYNRFAAFWREVHDGEIGAHAIDARLHRERLAPHTRTPFDELPDGAFVVDDDAAKLVLGDRLLRWSPSGYVAPAAPPPRSHAVVITPPSLVALLRAGWQSSVPLLHPSAVRS